MPKVYQIGYQMDPKIAPDRGISGICWRTAPEGPPGDLKGAILVSFWCLWVALGMPLGAFWVSLGGHWLPFGVPLATFLASRLP